MTRSNIFVYFLFQKKKSLTISVSGFFGYLQLYHGPLTYLRVDIKLSMSHFRSCISVTVLNGSVHTSTFEYICPDDMKYICLQFFSTITQAHAKATIKSTLQKKVFQYS